MQVPPEISFRHMRKPEGADDLIAEAIERLEEVHDGITSCRLTVERPHKHRQRGRALDIQLLVHVPPGKDIVVSNHPAAGEADEPFAPALRRVFDRARRQLKDLHELQHREIKSHPQQERQGIVSELFRDEGYGFLREAETNQEVYFSASSVLNDEFDEIEVGTIVRYVPETGEEGEQASTVQIVKRADV
jgi:cold shock CspA family protein